ILYLPHITNTFFQLICPVYLIYAAKGFVMRLKNDYNHSFRRYNRNIKRWMFVWGSVIVFCIIFVRLWNTQKLHTNRPSYTQFYKEAVAGKVDRALLVGRRLKGAYISSYKDGMNFDLLIPIEDQSVFAVLRKNVPDFRVRHSVVVFSSILLTLVPVFLCIIVMWVFLSYHFKGSSGIPLKHFSKSRAKRMNSKTKVTFNDIAGIEEAKEELREIIEFLINPAKFQKLGGRIPKGVILMGAPGTGKTLLAKAIAGEANVPFFSISGSDFVELYVGIGASRVRDLFKRAKKNAPCIVFLDEIDAVGRSRTDSLNAANDEREHTLNALLVEMDGFTTEQSVIIIAATNRPDVLDPALLRPGRFDRQVVLDLPDLHERLGILKVHTKKIVLSNDVELEKIARVSAGFSGADLANLVNEAALLAVRNNSNAVGMAELEESRDKVKWGRERKTRVLANEGRKINAYHEAGHALVLYLENPRKLYKVSIIPRGSAYLGATMQLPQNETLNKTKKQIFQEITCLMAGRAAEEIVFNDVSTGAGNDIQNATRLARFMVCQWGMSETIGPIQYDFNDDAAVSNNMVFSDLTVQKIDNEIKKIIDLCYQNAKDIIGKNKDVLTQIADSLFEKEVLGAEEIGKIVNSISSAQ
ncbi:ATP-dependent zinc metalloprotease FtsH, partial [bacterium]|nr:ATP-dependent zinc metalloprotease FtsH [bacterium]